MSKGQRVSLLLLRLSLGWLFFYAGITKLLNPEWSAAGYLKTAKTFGAFYGWLMSPGILPVVNFLNEWGLTLVGVALILGIFVRLAAFWGIILMTLYYLPVLQFPYVGHGLIVDEHLIYGAALLALLAFRAGRIWGLDKWCSQLPFCSRHPRIRRILG